MNKIALIIHREYLTRVKKRSFIILTLLGPILLALPMIVPIIIANQSLSKIKSIAIIDDSKMYKGCFVNNETYLFSYLDEPIDSVKNNMSGSDFYALVYIPETTVILPEKATIYSSQSISIDTKTYIRTLMSNHIENIKLESSGIDKDILATTKSNISLNTIKISDQGKEEKSSSEIAVILSMVSAFLIYIFIFMYASQVMRGVFEEKSNRIVEIIISSVKPFELMMGKIVGIALVGLTQFILWAILTLGIYAGFTTFYADQIKSHQSMEMAIVSQQYQGENIIEEVEMSEVQEIFSSIKSINFPLVISCFIFFFLGGYLFYSALFAAVGSAVDNESDTQQFMWPITIPLILAIVMSQQVIKDPDSILSFWLSIIPFTSPIIMMMRIPFGIPVIDMVLSASLLILGFLATTWVAAKIYRIGILMYGKKATYQDLWRWIRTSKR